MNKEKREQTLFRIINGEGFYIAKEVEIPMQEFNRLFPLQRKVQAPSLTYKGENSDHSKRWLDE